MNHIRPVTAAISLLASVGLICATAIPASAAVKLRPAWGSAIEVRGLGYANAFDVSPTPDGGAYVIGTFNRSARFGNTTLEGSASTGYLAKVSSRGRWQWAIKTAESAAIESGVTTTPDGGVILCTVSKGENFLSPGSDTDTSMVVAKVAADSSVQWATGMRASFSGTCSGAEALSDGGAIVAGSRWLLLTNQGFPVTDQGSALLGRVSASGVWQWITGMGGSDAAIHGIDLTAQGTIVAGGNFKRSGAFGPTTLTDPSTPTGNTGSATGNGFVAFATVDGAVTSAQQLSSPERSQVQAVTALRDGSVVVAGTYRESLTAGSQSVEASTFEPGYAAALEADGTWSWIYQWSGSNFGSATGVTQTNDGSIIVSGQYNTTEGAYIRLNDQGKRTKVYRVRGGAISPNAVAADDRGGFLSAGTLFGTWTVKGNTRIKNGGSTATGYVARFR